MDVPEIARAVMAGDRRALARAVTLIESTRPDRRAMAEALLGAVSAKGRQALRIGLSGTPGVGKSTFLEAFGLMLADAGHSLAVLAVDPVSPVSGGSILGDKTRMARLARTPGVWIRPSPGAADAGGIARRTRETVALCEAAGFDIILVETIGVGQSEALVDSVCDIFVLLIAPGGGDELQGVKRGILEVADILLVNKADGPLADAAARTCADYTAALHLRRDRSGDLPDTARAMCVSALTGRGLSEAWDAVRTLVAHRRSTGLWSDRRRAQAGAAFLTEVRHGLLAMLDRPEVAEAMADLAGRVDAGTLSPEAAARAVLSGLVR